MIAILWDSSHVWGYLLLHAVRSAGVPFRILKASEIPQTGIPCKLFLPEGRRLSCRRTALFYHIGRIPAPAAGGKK